MKQLAAVRKQVKVREVCSAFDGRTLLRALGRKLIDRMIGRSVFGFVPIAEYSGVIVFDRPELDGGGREFGQDYHRVLRQLLPGGCGRLFELCAGPAYIGYSLLAAGFCKQLVVADINPIAMRAANKTAEFNRLTDCVTIYRSNALNDIDPGERWDVVVGNPPHFIPTQAGPKHSLILFDAEWKLHREFYSRVKHFLNPGATVILQENSQGSDPSIFEPMILAGGGRLEQVLPCDNPAYYYVVSKYE